MDLQSDNIEDDLLKLVPVSANDFEALYEVASDPLIWEQHPSRDRYKREVFQNFFESALESKGAFLVVDKKTGVIIGSSRYYEYNEENSSVAIGYTFLSRQYWGTTYNKRLKSIMLNYAFASVDTVIFHIGEKNLRSQKAIAKLGAVKYDEQPVAYAGEPTQNINYFYKITRENWVRHQP